MPTAMTSLARLGKDHMFLWAWGINGCFSVIGAAAVPIIATSFGFNAVLVIAGVAYVFAMPAFFAVLLPLNRERRLRRRQRRQRHRHDHRDASFARPGRRRACSCRPAAAAGAVSAPAPKRELAPLPSSKTALVPFEVTPFPYRGEVPDKNRPFLDVADGERHGQSTVRGGTYWEDQTYSDQRVLLHIPKGFDPPARRSCSGSSTATKRRSNATCAIARRCRGRSI